jgi:hypothetical protein
VISGLWSLSFSADPPGLNYDYEAARLLFTAGIQGESAGVVGNVKAAAPFQTPVR